MFLDAERKLRSGWVIVLFFGCAGLIEFLGMAFLAIARLGPRTLSLDDWHLGLNTTLMLVAASVPTVLCLAVLRADAGLPEWPMLRHLGLGLGLGAALVAFAVGIPAITGHSPLTFTPSAELPGAALLQFAILTPTSVGEELLVRGVVLRQLAKGTRPWFAIVATGGLFGVMHLVNPNSTPIAAINVALVGFWFGVLAWRTSLWTAIGAHVAWNWCEGFVFGQPVSGITPGPSLFGGTVTPPGFFSGGAFGPEASGLTTVLLVAATLAAIAWRIPKSLDTTPQFPWKPPA